MEMSDKNIEDELIKIGEKIYDLFRENNYNPSICVSAMMTCIFGLVHEFHKNPKEALVDISHDFLNMSQSDFKQTIKDQGLEKDD